MSEQKPGIPNEQPELSEADDLQMALAAFGDDLLDILNEDDDEAIPSEESAADPDPVDSAGADSAPFDSAAETSPHTQHAELAACDVAVVDPLERLLDQYGDKLNDDSNLAYAGSIALACNTAADSAHSALESLRNTSHSADATLMRWSAVGPRVMNAASVVVGDESSEDDDDANQ